MDSEHNNSSANNNSRSLIEAAFHACIANHHASLRIQTESVVLEVNGRLIELLLPASIMQGKACSDKDEVFIAIGLDLSADDPLQWVLNDLNEKLERIPPVHSSLGFVFQSLLYTLNNLSTHGVDDEGNTVGDDEGAEEDLDRSFCIDEHDNNLDNHQNFRSPHRSSNLATKQSEKNDNNNYWQMETFERVLLEAEEVEEEEGMAEKLILEGKMTNLISNEEMSYATLHAIKKEYINAMKAMKAEAWKSNNDKEGHFPILGGVRISIPDEGNICKWHVRLDPILFKSYPLYEDMQNYARDKEGEEVGIELEFLFPPNYPFSPPFVKVVSPKLMLYSGQIGEKGELCMETLTEGGWNPTYSFESVLVLIVDAIIQGDGRLDTATLDDSTISTWDYSTTEYSEMDDRMTFGLPSLNFPPMEYNHMRETFDQVA